MRDHPSAAAHRGSCHSSGAGAAREGAREGIDLWMPRFAHRLTTTRTIARPRAAVWNAMLHVTSTELRLARVLGVLGSLGRGVRDRHRVRDSPFSQAVARFGWIVLEEVPGRRTVVGLVVRVHPLGVSLRRMLPPAEFAGFAEPGWVKVAVAHDLTDVLDGTSVTAELRMHAADPRTARRLRWAFRALRPAACALLGNGIEAMKRHAESGS